MMSHWLRPVFHGSLCVERHILSNHQLKKPPTLFIIFQIFTAFAHLRHMVSRRKVLWRDIELCVSRFPFLFQFLIAQSLISLGLCRFAHLRFMCKYACGMCARLGLLITKCALSRCLNTHNPHPHTVTACIFASSLDRVNFPFANPQTHLSSSPPPAPTKILQTLPQTSGLTPLLQQAAFQVGCWIESSY